MTRDAKALGKEKSCCTTHIVGAGGVGFWLAVGLVRSDINPLIVYDDDNLQGGLGHSRLPQATATTYKVDLLRGFLLVNFLSAEMPTFVKKKFTGNEVVEGDLVVDCTDMSDAARKRIWNRALKKKARCIRVSYDGANSVVAVAEGIPLSGDRSAAGYESVPSLALSLMAGGVGAETIAKTDWQNTPYLEFQISIAELIGKAVPLVQPTEIKKAKKAAAG